MKSLICFILFLLSLTMSLNQSSAFSLHAPHNKASFRPSYLATPTAFSTFINDSTSTITSTQLHGKKAARAQGNDRKNKTVRVKKQKDDVIEVEAVIIESLPNAMFRCSIDGAPETQPPILATISGKIRKNWVKILVGDSVTIELSPYDLTRGRITFRKR
jgi:translation initiation factor IF-1